jgi:hypothetical protein
VRLDFREEERKVDAEGDNTDGIPLRITQALNQKNGLRTAFNHRRNHFAESVGLLPKTKGRALTSIPTIHLPMKKKEYPPSGYDIYEADETREVWEKYRAATLYPDRRGGKTWKPLLKLDPVSLQHTVNTNESAIIKDKKSGGIIGVVIRNFSNGNEGLLDWINQIIAENNDVRKSVRVCSISNPCLNWCSQLLLVRGSRQVVPDRLHIWSTQ